MTKFVDDSIIPLLEDKECRRIVVRAPVKSGKREMVEYIAMRDYVGQPIRVHAFISAWYRKADEEQREELDGQNIKVFSITNANAVDRCLTWIQEQITLGLQVVLHLDECDHGSGSGQNLSRLWREVRNNESVNNVLYSATPEEVLYSGEVDNDELNAVLQEAIQGHRVVYTPPDGYCGPGRFLSEKLVHIAFPFFEKSANGFALSQQGASIIRDLKDAIVLNPRRNVVVLRLSYSDGGNKKENKAIHQFVKHCASFPELEDVSVIVDVDKNTYSSKARQQTVDWSSKPYWDDLATGAPKLILVDQKSSRSTEWACHDRVFATHDFRNTVQFSTVSQPVERVNHYEKKYGGFQPIRVYCHMKTLSLSAGKISYADYGHYIWEARKLKLDARTSGGAELFVIRSVANKQPHPKWPEAVDAKTRDRALQELECFAKIGLSARVKGSVVEQRVYRTEFHPVEPDGWSALVASLHLGRPVTRSFHNPFPLSKSKGLENDKFKGRLACRKGEALWRVLDYDLDVKSLISWGHTEIGPDGMDKDQRVICYRDGVCGVAVRIDTGEKEKVDTLKAFRSMYGSQKPAIRLRTASESQ
jgi:hypothetical protein